MTSPYLISAFSGYNHRSRNLTRTCKADCSVDTCTVSTLTYAAPVLYSIFNYYSTITYTCQDRQNHAAGELTRTCEADGLLTETTPVYNSK